MNINVNTILSRNKGKKIIEYECTKRAYIPGHIGSWVSRRELTNRLFLVFFTKKKKNRTRHVAPLTRYEVSYTKRRITSARQLYSNYYCEQKKKKLYVAN